MKSYDQPRQHIKKQALLCQLLLCLYSQSYCFSSSHVWMWELDHKEGWASRNWCFWTVVLKTLESPLDCSLSGFPIHGILQARTLEWVAISFSRGSSWSRDCICISCLACELFTTEPPGKTFICLFLRFFFSLMSVSPRETGNKLNENRDCCLLLFIAAL